MLAGNALETGLPDRKSIGKVAIRPSSVAKLAEGSCHVETLQLFVRDSFDPRSGSLEMADISILSVE